MFHFSPFHVCSWVIGAGLLFSSVGCGGGTSLPKTVANVSSTIAFISTRSGTPEIYVMNPDGSEQTRVTTNIESANNPSQSHDGRIVFESNRDGNSEIYTINRDGSDLSRLTNDTGVNPAQDVQPAFSPDGKTIAWTSTRGDSSGANANIWLMNTDGSNKRQFVFNTTLADGSSSIESSNPAWSPNGKQLAYLIIPMKDNPIGNNGIQMKNIITGEVTVPDYRFGPSSHLRFNNGSKVIYSTPLFQSSGNLLSIYDFSSKEIIQGPRAQYSPVSNDRSPDFSPDGRNIVWDAIVDGRAAQIYRTTGSDENAVALTTQGENYSPDW